MNKAQFPANDATKKQPVQMIDYRPEHKDIFKAINVEWLEDMFKVEPYDDYVLSNPQEMILDKGGKIFLAEAAELGVVGTCAIFIQDDGFAELTKMAVLKKARGLKIGEKLLQHVLAEAEKLGLRLYLLTNSDCEAAIHLYLKNGFEHDAALLAKYGPRYERCNVAMLYKPAHKP